MEREQLLALAESMMGMAIDNLRRDGYVAFATLVLITPSPCHLCG